MRSLAGLATEPAGRIRLGTCLAKCVIASGVRSCRCAWFEKSNARLPDLDHVDPVRQLSRRHASYFRRPLVEIPFHRLADMLRLISETLHCICHALSLVRGSHRTIRSQFRTPSRIFREVGLFDPRTIDGGDGTIEEPKAHVGTPQNERPRERNFAIESQVVEPSTRVRRDGSSLSTSTSSTQSG